MSTSSVDEIVYFQQTKIYLKCLSVTSDTLSPETYKFFFTKKSKKSSLFDTLIKRHKKMQM